MLTEKQKPMSFVGREYEKANLLSEFERPRASLIVMHGRRRVGKTRLLQEFCRDKHSLWIEGLEKGTPQEQRTHFIKQLAEQTKQPFLSRSSCSDWTEAFDCLKELFSVLKKSKRKTEKLILVLDEFPWLISQDEKTVALFKYYWDNFFKQHNLMIVLCGSINTFMIKKVIQSSALYGRIHQEVRLDPLSPSESGRFLGSTPPKKDVVEYSMIFGGIPRYWEEIDPRKSVIQNLNRLCFLKDAFFVREFARLFREEFGSVNVYAAIIKELARTSSLNYTEILKRLKSSVGGGYQEYLDNLSLAGFVNKFTPLNKKKTRLVRYRLWDEFIHFYSDLIEPSLDQIAKNTRENFLFTQIDKTQWSVWTGLAFERFCIKQTEKIQQVLKIDQLVKNQGSYFSRATTAQNGLQIDLMFDRHDQIVTLCEIKYTNRPVGTELIDEVERKAALYKLSSKQSLQPVLITFSPPTQALIDARYFSHILMLEDLV